MQNSRLIAIVDDDPFYRKILCRVLQIEKFEIAFQAENGLECLSFMKDIPTPPRFIVMDIEMPQMDGFETARHIRKKWPNVSIIAHTSLISEDVQWAIDNKLMDHYVPKSSSVTQLASIIKSCCTHGVNY